MIYHEIVVDFPPEHSFNPLAILQDTLKEIAFHFRWKRDSEDEINFVFRNLKIYVGAILLIFFSSHPFDTAMELYKTQSRKYILLLTTIALTVIIAQKFTVSGVNNVITKTFLNFATKHEGYDEMG